MINDILQAANMYAEGLKNVQARRDEWVKMHTHLCDHLKEIATELNTKGLYKQMFYVDTAHAFDEEMNGTSADMPSITLRSSDMPIGVKFQNPLGEKKEYVENGFHITFSPVITGQLIVTLLPHYSDTNGKPPESVLLAVIDDLSQLTDDATDNIVAQGIATAFYSSFTGMAERPEEGEEKEKIPPPPAAPRATSPIGFKRYETTEKVQ